jgi:capsular exopolysaccharide synthesis family protein
MTKDERLLPLPKINDIAAPPQETATTYAPVYDEDPFAEKRSIREYLSVVLKRKWLILTIITLVTLLTALYMYRLPSVYEAKTVMLIEPRRPKPQSKDSININFGNDLEYKATQLKLIQNPDLMKRVVIKLGLYREPNLLAENTGPGLFNALRTMVVGEKAVGTKEVTLPVLTTAADTTPENTIALTPEEDKRAEGYAYYLLGGLSVVPVEKTSLVEIRMQSSNPELAARVTDMVSELFKADNIKREIEGTQKTYDDLTKSIGELQQTIAQQEQERLNQMNAANLSVAEKGDELNFARLQEKSKAWLDAENDRRKLQAEYESALKAKQRGTLDSLPAVVDNPSVQAAKEYNRRLKADMEKRLEEIDKRTEEYKAKLNQLKVKYTDEYWEVKQMREAIAAAENEKSRVEKEVTAKLKNEDQRLETKTSNDVLNVAKARYDAALRREIELRNDYLREQSSANAQGVVGVKLRTKNQEIETNRTLLNNYTQKQKELELQITSSVPDNISISTPAQKPTAPIGPQRTRNITVAFLIALAASIGLAFLLDYLDDSIKSSDDIGRHLGLPTLALIPHISLEKRNMLKSANGTTTSTALIALENHRSALAEAYRHLRTSLLFSSAGKPPQTILITSSQPSEGKTTTVINTAITLAQAGAEVIIVDCDLRRPRLHQHFSMENTHGVTNFLSGERNVEALIKTVDQLPNLKVITSGPIPPNPAELLGSNDMRSLLEFLKGNYKHIIVDSPPAISFTDAAVLSTLVDGVVIVTMSGKSSLHLTRRFKQRLQNIGARIYGVVLGGLKRHSLDYGYGYGYGYTYGYYYDYGTPDESTPTMENGNGKGSKNGNVNKEI